MVCNNVFLLLLIMLIFSCNENDKRIFEKITGKTDPLKQTDAPAPEEESQPEFRYHFIKKKEWQALKKSFEGVRHLDILNAINRVDTTHLKYLDSILVPDHYSGAVKDYLPFPDDIELLKDVNKIILFSYPTQSFAAYESGKLVLEGPTNMGRKKKPTPRGLFFTNWKARKIRSTVDDEWLLKWNFNVQNKWGVGFHEYAMPGYPASHSCMRLSAADAKFLYKWADQWILRNDREIAARGTPVIIFGKYPFGKSKPWYKLVKNPNALTIHMDTLRKYIEPHLPEIMEEQEQRQHLASPE